MYQTPPRYNVGMVSNTGKPKLIVEDGRAVGVVLDIAVYEQMLERLEEAEDLEAIRRMRAEDWQTVPFDEYLAGDRDVSD